MTARRATSPLAAAHPLAPRPAAAAWPASLRAVVVLALALLLWPAQALAHVTVLPEVERPGETADLTFRVQNERDDARTTQLDVYLPAGVPAEVAPHDGWTSTRIGDAVRWTADEGEALAGGRTADFKVRLGPLPDAPRLVFKALQYYDDGEVVRWIQDSGPDDERPAAILDLGGGTSADGSGGGGSPLILIIIAVVLVAGAAGLLLARRRRTPE